MRAAGGVLLFATLASTNTWALSAATSVPMAPSASLHAVVGFPDAGLGFRIPFWQRRLNLILGAGVRFPLAAPTLDAGLGYQLRLPGPLRVDAAATGGVMAPLLPPTAVVTRAEVVTRGILEFRYARFWTGPQLTAATGITQTYRFDVGAAWTLGAQLRLWVLELGVVGALGARAAHNRAPWSVAPQAVVPDGRLLFTAAWVVPEHPRPW